VPDFEAIRQFVAHSACAVLRSRVLWLAALVSAQQSLEQRHTPAAAAAKLERPRGWLNMQLHEMSHVSTMLAALADLVLYLAALPRHHQRRFVQIGGCALISRQISAAAAMFAQKTEQEHARAGDARHAGSVWCACACSGSGVAACVRVEVELLDKDAHDYKTCNLLFDLMFSASFFAAHPAPMPRAAVLYLEASEVLCLLYWYKGSNTDT